MKDEETSTSQLSDDMTEQKDQDHRGAPRIAPPIVDWGVCVLLNRRRMSFEDNQCTVL